MTDREIIETILEQKGNNLKTRLIEYTKKLEFTDYNKNKKIHLCPGAEDEEDYNNLIIGATILAKKADDIWFVINYERMPSADFIVRYGLLYKYIDQKTINSFDSIEQTIRKHQLQARRFFLKIAIFPCRANDFAAHVRKCFFQNENLSEIIISEGGKYISILRNDAISKKFFEWVKKNWK